MGKNKNKNGESGSGSPTRSKNEFEEKLRNNGILLDTTKVLKNKTPGPKYMKIERKGNSEDMAKVSPFLIHKFLQNVCGEVQSSKLTQAGYVLVETKNEEQARKLIQVTQMSNEIKVNISENERLNQSKGVIFAKDLLCVSEEEIVAELKDQQHVTEVYRVKKRMANGTMSETGVFFVTFSTRDVPNELNAGYTKFSVRP